jgi:hypothetical protein
MTPPSRAVGAGKAAGLDGRHDAIDEADAATEGVAELVGFALPVAPQLVSTATPAARPKILNRLAECPTPA